jgi:prepilin-type N-terminal cleavage/methylation domain-containing protein
MRSRVVVPISPASPLRHTRSGFTLVEVLVALFVINVGLLALAAGSAVVIRQTTQSRARARALRIAANRLETLSAGLCSAAAGSAVGAFSTREEWSVALPTPETRDVRDSVAFDVQGATYSVVLRTRIPC